MGEVRLHAIGVDEVRDLFSGNPDAAARLTDLAMAAFPPPPPASPHVGLLSKVGPLLRRPPGAPVVRPGVPTRRDLDDLVHGHELALDRLSAGWALVRLWLDDRAFGRLTLTLGEHQLDDLDFALTRAGLDARFALRRLFNDQLALPVKALPGQVTGYARHGHARAMAAAWRPACDGLPDDLAPLALDLVGWLDRFAGWADDARDAGRPAPDLVAAWQAAPD